MWQKSVVTYVTLPECYIRNATNDFIIYVTVMNAKTQPAHLFIFCFIYNSVERVGNIMQVCDKNQLLQSVGTNVTCIHM